MVSFTRLSGQACRRTSQLRDRTLSFPVEEVDYQDYKVLQWQKALPPALALKLNELKESQQRPLTMTTDSMAFLATVLHARAHQLRSLIYRPVLYSPARVAENKRHAQAAVDIAKESVQFLTLIDRKTTFVRDEPLFFRDFLISALAGILLAVSNASTEYSGQVSGEFFSILDLLRTLSSKSPDMARVWNTIKILETAAPRLGLIRFDAPVDPAENDRSGDTSFGNYPNQVPGSLQSKQRLPFTTSFSPQWDTLEPVEAMALKDVEGIPFPTSMFPTQLRNELSILTESTFQVPLNFTDFTFPENFNTNTAWF